MIDKKEIQNLLIEYGKHSDDEHYKKTKEFVDSNENIFGRDNLSGHITGSAWIVNRTHDKVLLIHHKKLNLWLQPGGHFDEGDPTIIETARREVIEETGLKSVSLLHSKLFDLDVHLIPERKGIPAHYHYDFRFLFCADDDALNPNYGEVNDIKWVAISDIIKDNRYTSLHGMAKRSVDRSR